ncbi:hypothetical protein HHK36_012320 [Tetracentron sinense]|uniref:Uncharacterized protein n=1 Tax=Tetracentron sinense TaxID=13715 RepID=A0A834Z8A7_TETSI|nr:hypothetical protein HHK36_012320 [Tetracentron sinense]
MHRPASMRFHMPQIPCVNRHVDFDFDFNGDDVSKDDGRRSFLRDDEREDYKIGAGGDDGHNYEMVPCEEEGIDLRAEDFITKFYEHMKLQRQISNLQYNEMLIRCRERPSDELVQSLNTMHKCVEHQKLHSGVILKFLCDTLKD